MEQYRQQIDLATCLQQGNELGSKHRGSAEITMKLPQSQAQGWKCFYFAFVLAFFSGSSLKLHLFPSRECNTYNLPINIIINVIEGDT